MAETKFSVAKESLNDFTKLLIEKGQLIEDLESKINTNSIKEKHEVKFEAIDELKQHTILTEDDWHQFILKFDKVHIGFNQKLKENFKDISAAKIRFLCL